MIGNILELEPNKVSINLMQYSMVIMGDTGVGKTTTLLKILKELDPNKEPLFLEWEDRFQNIPGITAIKINTMSDFKSVIGQLRNPVAKEKFSCIVADTLDKYEEFCERYVTENRDAEILKDVGAFGEGTMRFKSALRNIGVLQSLGYTVHFIAQSSHSKDFDTKKESDSLKLNKNTFSYCREAAYLVGYMWEEKGERFLTFKKTAKYPDLKDTFGLPDKINAKDLKSVWIETIKNFGDEFVTSNKTIDKTIKLENFESIKNKGIELGTLLANNGHLDEATAVLQKNIGLDEDGNVKSFDCLRENQLDLTKIIVMDLEELVDKYKLK
mgnify:CR=1 FL=1